MDELPDWFQPSRDLRIPFIFVPHGAPDPVEWKAAHPGWVKFPATFVPRHRPDESLQSEPAVAEQTEHPAPQPGMMAAFSRRPEPPPLHSLDPFDPLSPGFDAVATLRQIGYLPPSAQPVQWWFEPFVETPLTKPPEEIVPRFMERIPGQSGKEAANDTPSWARGVRRLVGETPEQYARRVMNDRWGRGKWENDPDREPEFSQIKKFGSRAFRNPKLDPLQFAPDRPEGA